MGVALAVVDGPCLQVRLRHPERFLAVEGDEPVPLDRCQPGDRLHCLGDPLVDPAERIIISQFPLRIGFRKAESVLLGLLFPFRMGFREWLPVLWRAAYCRRCRLDDTD